MSHRNTVLIWLISTFILIPPWFLLDVSCHFSVNNRRNPPSSHSPPPHHIGADPRLLEACSCSHNPYANIPLFIMTTSVYTPMGDILLYSCLHFPRINIMTSRWGLKTFYILILSCMFNKIIITYNTEVSPNWNGLMMSKSMVVPHHYLSFSRWRLQWCRLPGAAAVLQHLQ